MTGAERAARFAAAHPDRMGAKWSYERARDMRRVPAWFGELDELVMLEAHDLARRRAGEWSVDHIVPLCGYTVSGLHVWNNVQVITAYANQAKGNYYWENYVPFDFTVVARAGLTQAEFAMIAGVSRVSANMWIRGKITPHKYSETKIESILVQLENAIKHKLLPLDRALSKAARAAYIGDAKRWHLTRA